MKLFSQLSQSKKYIFISYIFIVNEIKIIWATDIFSENVQRLFLYK